MNPIKQLFQALSTDSALLALLGGEVSKISEHYPQITISGNVSTFPKITYNVQSRKHIFYTDNVPKKDSIIFDIDIWLPHELVSQVTISNLSKEIDRIMIALNYNKLDSSDGNFNKEKIFNQTLSYEKAVATSSI